jgi:hypothetical protein
MTQLLWDQVGEKVYETGVDHGVLYIPDATGDYVDGYAWNGLTAVTETPSGAESNKQYADNQVYVNLISAEEFGGTIEAFTYPDEFAQCDGTGTPYAGVNIGQQTRKTFGLSWRSLVGNDLEGTDFGYKIHVMYGAIASPSEKANNTVNDSPEAVNFSWEVTTTPIEVGTINSVAYKPASHLWFDSTQATPAQMAALEEILYGTVGQDPRLPLPQEIAAIFAGAPTEVETVAPTYDSGTDLITIPSVTGVVYEHLGEPVTGTVGPITADTVITARPASGYSFTATSDDDWSFNFA